MALDTNEFDEVERARALKTMPGVDYNPSATPDTDDLDGRESRIKGRTVEGKPDFGHNMLKYWGFAKDCESGAESVFRHPKARVITNAIIADVNLNHGELRTFKSDKSE